MGVFNDRVGAQIGNLPAHITNRLVHGIGKGFTRVATNDQGSFLRHKAGHIPAITRHDHRATFHGDAQARGGIPVNDHRSSANGGGRSVSRAPAHHHLAVHHGFGKSPTGAAGNFEGGAVNQSGAVIADASIQLDRDRFQDGNSQVVPGAGVSHQNMVLALPNLLLDFGVDLPGGPALAVYLSHTRTSLA